MDIKMIPLDQIKLNPKNRNKHPEDQIKRIVDIIKYQGFRRPGTISNQTGFLVCGEGRYLAAKKLKLKEMPVMFQDYTDAAQEYADGIADNAVDKWASLDLTSIQNDVLDFGKELNTEMLGILNFKLPDVFDAQCDEDEVPDQVEPKTKLGDIYTLGNHRLMCGDSTGIDAVEKLMNGEKADMVFTDPPYGVNYQSNWRPQSEKFTVIKGDDTFLTEWISVLPVVSVGWVFVWTSWKVLDKWIEITAPIGSMTNMIIWDKGGGGIGDLEKTFSSDYEVALVFNRGAAITGSRIGSVWSVGRARAVEYVHPTQKPVELVQMALENCTNSNSNILDLFGGSGSTLIACEKTNRKCFMMELDPHYCDVIIARWEKYTGKTAERIND